MPLALVYAAVVYLFWACYPVLFAELFPVEYKGCLVLLLPLPPLIVIALMALGLLPLFTSVSRSCLLCEITGLRRLGRQLTLYAPDHTRKVQQYVFYACNEAEAEAIQEFLTKYPPKE